MAAKESKDSSDEIGPLCLACLLEGNVVGAESMKVGTAFCELHATMSSDVPTDWDVQCRICEEVGKNHQAWTIRLGQPTCIFHTINDAFSVTTCMSTTCSI